MRDASSVGRLTQYRVHGITGSLSITRVALAWLPYLVEVRGHFLVGPTRDLQEVAVPDLVQVGGNVAIERNDALFSLIAPALSSVGGQVRIRFNPELPLCAAEAIVADADIGGGAVLEELCGPCACP